MGGTTVDDASTTTTQNYKLGMGQEVRLGYFIRPHLLGYASYLRSSGSQSLTLTIDNTSPLVGTYSGRQLDQFQTLGAGARLEFGDLSLKPFIEASIGYIDLQRKLELGTPLGAVFSSTTFSTAAGAGLRWQAGQRWSLLFTVQAALIRMDALKCTSADLPALVGTLVANSVEFSRVGAHLGLGFRF